MSTPTYDQGFRDGLAAKPYPEKFEPFADERGYHDGWDAGNSDRLTLDELTIDAGMEASDPFGY